MYTLMECAAHSQVFPSAINADIMHGSLCSKTEVRKIQSSGKICILEVGDMQVPTVALSILC